MTNKRDLNEAEICDGYITPAIRDAGWEPISQIRREYDFTDGRVMVQKGLTFRKKHKRADYLLFYRPNLPLAVVEAKSNRKGLRDGLEQGLDYAQGLAYSRGSEYAKNLDVPFVFSSNGSGFIFLDRTRDNLEQELTLDQFPAPAHLWERYREWRGLEDDARVAVLTAPSPVTTKIPRYYQRIAINRTLEAIAKEQKRVLLTMATGTGKTFVAFQIMWRLWKQGKADRILFLADRNILVDQARVNDFQPFKQVMTKLTRANVDAHTGRVDTAYQVYLALYQAIMGAEDREPIYDKFPRDFFDLIVIDECHRGSAREDSQWREILEYFSSATQLGLTATPKETKTVSNIEYFGPPVYTYSLKEGINDGFLAPFKVVRVQLDVDAEGWTPEEGTTDDKGNPVAVRTYNTRDIDRNIVFTQRTELVAKRITDFLQDGDPMRKTIVFCEDIDHAERMCEALRALPENQAEMEKDSRYILRITGDATLGKSELENFINPKEPYPVIVTTSKLLSTGVDAQTCQLIVLDKRIESMTEFKQIIGRGTRLRPDYGKYYFTILDFKGATAKFNDDDWDGPPIQVYEPKEADPVAPPEPEADRPPHNEIGEVLEDAEAPPPDPRRKPPAKVTVSGVEYAITSEWVQHFGPDGEMVTESFTDFSRLQVTRQYATLEDFLKAWNSAKRKTVIIEELERRGLSLEHLEQRMGREYDPFDLICSLAFNKSPLTRAERVKKVKKRDPFSQYSEPAQKVLEALLEKFAQSGVLRIERTAVLTAAPFTGMDTLKGLMRRFRNKAGYLKALEEMEAALYAEGLDATG